MDILMTYSIRMGVNIVFLIVYVHNASAMIELSCNYTKFFRNEDYSPVNLQNLPSTTFLCTDPCIECCNWVMIIVAAVVGWFWL